MKQTALRLMLCAVAMTVVAACGGGGGGADHAEAPAPEPAAPVAAASTGSGSISGLVSFSGEDTDADIAMDADPVCLGLHESPVQTEAIVADGGNLANVFVYVKEGVSGSYPVPTDAVVLDQNGCQYTPHVLGVRTGQQLIIRNSDPTLHNVHALPSVNAEFNQGQPIQGMELPKTFDQQEVMVRFKCDVHPWMSAYIGVLDHPYFAVSGADGSFEITGLPAGDYVVEAWHEELGTQTQNVTVGDGDVAVAFDFAAAAG